MFKLGLYGATEIVQALDLSLNLTIFYQTYTEELSSIITKGVSNMHGFLLWRHNKQAIKYLTTEWSIT